MSELTITLLRLGYLALLWVLVLFAIGVLRRDLYGTRITDRAPAQGPRRGRRGAAVATEPAKADARAGAHAALDQQRAPAQPARRDRGSAARHDRPAGVVGGPDRPRARAARSCWTTTTRRRGTPGSSRRVASGSSRTSARRTGHSWRTSASRLRLPSRRVHPSAWARASSSCRGNPVTVALGMRRGPTSDSCAPTTRTRPTPVRTCSWSRTAWAGTPAATSRRRWRSPRSRRWTASRTVPTTRWTSWRRRWPTRATRSSRAATPTPSSAAWARPCSAILRAGNKLAMVHLGDSRGYLMRDGVLTQVTTDHTFVQHLVDTGRITPEEAEHHPQRSVVMRVLGDFDPEVTPGPVRARGAAGRPLAAVLRRPVGLRQRGDHRGDDGDDRRRRRVRGPAGPAGAARGRRRQHHGRRSRTSSSSTTCADGAGPTTNATVVGAAALSRNDPTAAADGPAARAAGAGAHGAAQVEDGDDDRTPDRAGRRRRGRRSRVAPRRWRAVDRVARRRRAGRSAAPRSRTAGRRRSTTWASTTRRS